MQCLEQMGPDIWPILVRLLDDPDRFVRNSAAEVFQNIGVLDSLHRDGSGHRRSGRSEGRSAAAGSPPPAACG
jgi:hypothetical protein